MSDPADPQVVPTPAGLRRVRVLVWVLVALALGSFLFLWLRPLGGGMGEITQRADPSANASAVRLGGPFTLTGADVKPFSSTQLAGKPYVIFFGFTHCPDVCPTTLSRLVRLRQALKEGDHAFEIVFVTVDPERDTPQAVGSYARLFNSPIIGLTGTRPQIDAVARQHGVFQAKVADPDAPDGYTMDHGAAALLFDRQGRFVSTISPEEPDSAALAKLKRIAA